jgi:serine/threonine protein kinase
MGTVWAAEHLDLDAKVAIKFIDPRAMDDWRAIERFAREARAAAALRGPHVVQVLDHGTYDDAPYMVMEYLQGKTLADHLEGAAPLRPSEVIRITTQVSRAMARAHSQGIVHRDLKPGNVFLVNDADEGYIVKVLDFGVAKALRGSSVSEDSITDSGTLLGTLQYMSPEQFRGFEVGHQTDLWSIAVMAFQCLVGVLPFPDKKPEALISAICSEPIVIPSHVGRGLPPSFDAWFARALERDPARRFQSARELADSLADALMGVADEPVLLTEVGRAFQHRTPIRLQAFSTHNEPRLRVNERIPSNIPAALDGQRDLHHVALVANISRTGALLWTRLELEVGQQLDLAIHFDDEVQGYETLAVVVRTSRRPPGANALWLFDVAVRFVEPLAHVTEHFDELRARVGEGGTPGNS